MHILNIIACKAKTLKPGKASAAHIDAIHQIARKQDDE
jgi:hypothetical protein